MPRPSTRGESRVAIDMTPAGETEPGRRAPNLAVPRVTVLGLGYVGLPMVLTLLEGGAFVTGVDISPERLAAIRTKRVDMQPDDIERLTAALELETFRLSSDPSCLAEADAVVICVPTPVDDYLTPELSALRRACTTVTQHARTGQTLILTSTTYVGATRELLVEPLAQRGLVAGKDVFIAFSPERIDPGSLGHASARIPRAVGGATPACTVEAAKILNLAGSDAHQVSSPEAAELTKLHENIFRAVNIALVNEMADVAGALGLDINEVIDAASTKPYGFMRFTPGPGVGGHCIPCDPHYLLWQLKSMHKSTPIIDQSMRSISLRPTRVIERSRELLAQNGKPVKAARVLIVGVAYKAGIEDVRQSPALEIMEGLIGLGAEVSFTDELVPSMRLRHGMVLESVSTDSGPYDLAIVHTLHPGMDVDWLKQIPAVLDASFALRGVEHSVLV